MIDQRLEQHGGAGLVDRRVAFDCVHRLTDADFGREMDGAVDAFKRAGDDILVADVADDQFGTAREVFGTVPVAVNLLDQAVEHPNLTAAAKKLVGDRAADKSSSTGD